MLKTIIRRGLPVLLIAALVLAACGEGESEGPASDALHLQWVYSTSIADWAADSIAEFNAQKVKASDDRAIWIDGVAVDAGQAVSDMLGGGELPVLWTAADPSWREVLHTSSGTEVFAPTCVSVAQSPLVIAMWEPVARALGWPGRTLGWLDVASLAADPSGWAYYSGGEWGDTLRIGHAHPGLSDSGVQTLQALVYAAEAEPDRITVEAVEDTIVQASVGAFESAVAWFSTDTALLSETMLARGITYLNAAVVYENAVVMQGGRDPRLVAIYPFEGTFMATYPTCVRASMDAVTTQAAETFIAHLISTPYQERALALGLRPVTAEVPLSAPIDPAYGADPDQPSQLFATAPADTVFAIQELWQSQRKHVNLAMVLDVSGSMEGDKIDQVRRSAMAFVEAMGDRDRLTVIVFHDYPEVLIDDQLVGDNRAGMINTISGIRPGGQTALFDSIAFAAEGLQAGASTDEVNAMVVLTDGMDTASQRFRGPDTAFSQVVSTAHASVYTIAYGDDADEGALSDIAFATNGIAYEGDVATIGDIYAEISAAFGGSQGIGR